MAHVSKTRNVIAKRRKPTVDPAKPVIVETAIIGGGIAGLYCAYKLRKARHGFLVAESTNHIGGRIWSTRILENGDEVPDGHALPRGALTKSKSSRRLEFCAEFGPMRLELELQKELAELLDDLKFKSEDYEPFPPYESPTSEHDPKYELEGEEVEQSTPFDLLILAIVRILGRLRAEGETDQGAASLGVKLRGLFELLSKTAATRQPIWKEYLLNWIKLLGEPDYQNIRQFGVFDDGTKTENGNPRGTPLWMMGFWNLLSEVLSHHAVMKIRDLGAFYHLIPENPNAAEWLIFWLRGLRTSEAMVGIHGGMEQITQRIVSAIGPQKVKTGHKLIGIRPLPPSKIRLEFENGATWHAERVILALPKAPLTELVRANKDHFYSNIHEDLDSVFAFPMLKLFLIIKERWWNQDFTRTNRYATLIPAREIHYRSSHLEGSKKGMILLYTDRPASSFWANYVEATGAQNEPERGKPRKDSRLIHKVLKYLKHYGVQSQDVEHIQFYGIRDWGREPFDGANHAWRPERQSWMVLRRLSGFQIGPGRHNGSDENVYICGEAYSDYHGFIEGALRSAAHVLHRIDSSNFPHTPTMWLCDSSHGNPQCKYVTKKKAN